jgi:hypothetical protein
MTKQIRVDTGVIRRWPSAATRRWFESFVADIAADDNVLALVAVGSAVRSNVRSDDLDLVVICADRKKFRHKAPIEVDLHVFHVLGLDAQLGSGHPVLGWAVRFGKAVLDRLGKWSEVVGVWSDRVPLPDPALARHRASKAAAHLDAVREMGDEAAAAELNLSYLTLLARAVLAEHRIYPASRPELPEQLRAIGETSLADQLEGAWHERENVFSRRVG